MLENNSDYVKKRDVLKTFGDIHPLDYNEQGIVHKIKNLPSADVVEVRHGRWVKHGYYRPCSMCGWDSGFGGTLMEVMLEQFKYCPYCGTKMDEKFPVDRKI